MAMPTGKLKALPKFATLNIGGQQLRMRWDTLLTGDSQSRLCKFAMMTRRERRMYADGYNIQTDEYFFERPVWEAAFLYNYYLFGTYHTCEVKCIEQLANCLHYWKIPIDSACTQPQCRRIGSTTAGASMTTEAVSQDDQQAPFDDTLTRLMSNMDNDEATADDENVEKGHENAINLALAHALNRQSSTRNPAKMALLITLKASKGNKFKQTKLSQMTGALHMEQPPEKTLNGSIKGSLTSISSRHCDSSERVNLMQSDANERTAAIDITAPEVDNTRSASKMPKNTSWSNLKSRLFEGTFAPMRKSFERRASADDVSLDDEVNIDAFDKLPFGAQRRFIWELMENPKSSICAQFVAIISMVFILISVGGLILGSIPTFQRTVNNPLKRNMNVLNKTELYAVFTSCLTVLTNGEFSNNQVKMVEERRMLWQTLERYHNLSHIADVESEPHEVLELMEIVCVIWFSFEFGIRFLVAADRKVFIKQSLNIIDLLTIVPFYLELATQLLNVNSAQFKEFKAAMLVVRVLRVARVARIFRLARYSSGLQTIGDTFRKSMKELSMLMMFLATGIIFFSTIMYFLEKDVPASGFNSIPASCWWCVVTMTTVGYGDLVPQTFGGKITATFTSICGIIVLAFPISMIVEKFAVAQDEVSKSMAERFKRSTQRATTQSLCKPRRRMKRRRTHPANDPVMDTVVELADLPVTPVTCL